MIQKVDFYRLSDEFHYLDEGYGHMGDNHYHGYLVICKQRYFACDLIIKAKSEIPNQKFLIGVPITILSEYPYAVRDEYSRRVLNREYLDNLDPENVDVYEIINPYDVDCIIKAYVDKWNMMDSLIL